MYGPDSNIVPLVMSNMGVSGFSGLVLLKRYLKENAGKRSDGNIYYADHGFTGEPSILQKVLGKNIHPIDHPSELQNHIGEYVMMNGVYIKRRCRKEIEYMFPESPPSGPAADWCSDNYTPRKRYEDEVSLWGDFKGHHINTEVVDKIYNYTANLEGTTMYFMGKLKDQHYIHIETMGIAKSIHTLCLE